MIWSLEAEMAALGSMFSSERALANVARILDGSEFFREAHREIFEACKRLAGGLDLVTLKDELTKRKRLEDCGGEDYLIQIMEFVPSVANAEYYAGIIHEKAERRRSVEDAKELIRLAEGEAGIEEIRAQRSAMGETATGQTAIVSFADISAEGDDKGLPSFIPSLNALMGTGGWPCEQLSVASAYHKGGKSTFMLTDFLFAAERAERVLYATFADLSAQQLKRRLIKALCGWKKRPSVSDDLQKQYDNAVFNIDACWDAFVYDASALDDGDDVESFCAWVRAEHKRRPYQRIYVDYAQELTSRRISPADEYGTAAVCAKALAKLARQTGAAMIVGSQITEGSSVTGSKTKTKGSRRWEEVAGLVLRIERDGDETTVKVPFSRFSECGDGVEVKCRWERSHLRFVA